MDKIIDGSKPIPLISPIPQNIDLYFEHEHQPNEDEILAKMTNKLIGISGNTKSKQKNKDKEDKKQSESKTKPKTNHINLKKGPGTLKSDIAKLFHDNNKEQDYN